MVRCNGLVVMEMGNGVSALFYLQPHIFWRFGMFVDIFFRYIYNPLVCISDELHFQDQSFNSTLGYVCTPLWYKCLAIPYSVQLYYILSKRLYV